MSEAEFDYTIRIKIAFSETGPGVKEISASVDPALDAGVDARAEDMILRLMQGAVRAVEISPLDF